MSQPTKIIARGPDAATLLMLMKGELSNYGYESSNIKHEYDPTWGSDELLIEVKSNGGG
jgi:hypothetical protein